MNAIISVQRQRRGGRRALGRVEMLVLLCIATVLLSITLALICSARRNNAASECQNNIHQLADALLKYANDHNSMFPPNVANPLPGIRWSDANRIGRYVHTPDQRGETPGSIFACPADSGGICSYSMNFWASSPVDFVDGSQTAKGLMWDAKVPRPSQMILLAESWSYSGSAVTGFRAQPTIGQRGISAGQRFGGGTGLTPFDAGRFGKVNCELAYSRHRDRSAPATGTQPHGSVVMAFADGHVEIVPDSRVVDDSGRSTGVFRWTTADVP